MGHSPSRAAARRGRLAVGIDLGTTHTVVAAAPLEASDARPEVFPVPQLVSPTELEARALFSSALYAPVPGETVTDPFGDAPWVLGELARGRGAEVPGRLVASSKSWLSHAAVDRSAAILPWGAPEDADDLPRLSPVDAATRLLAHVRRAWDEAHPDHPLAEQRVVLTVPASFDEVGRELTVEAARRAGIAVRLLEEPQAAFYDYLLGSGTAELERLVARRNGRALVLVCDVGGGTTDLSLLRVTRGEGGRPVAAERVAVGTHLLLGGDNMDLALAHLAEPRLLASADRLDPARFSQLVLACRAAKEALLGEAAAESHPVTVLGHGAKLVGGALSTRIEREECERLVLDGFFPPAARDARPSQGRSALVAFGLPYARDVAVTRHLAWFFARHAAAALEGGEGEVPLGPDALLLNGGVFRARKIEGRVAAAIDGWGGPELTVLPHADPDLAVARGAVGYARALGGHGIRIEGGAAHGYYVGVDAARAGEPRRAICVVPRGAKEGVPQRAAGRTLALVVGRPVRFDLYASEEARADAPGDVVEIDDEGFQRLPPVAASIEAGAAPAGKQQERAPREVKVALEGELTAVGTLDLACIELEPEHAPGEGRAPRRFRLAFQLREAAEAEGTVRASARPPSMAPAAGGRRLDEAREAVRRVFGQEKAEAGAREAKNLLRELERILGERPTWPLPVLRALFDSLVEDVRARRRSAEHERVFWLLAGYGLRPGFGDARDPERAARLARVFPERLAFPQEARGWQQLWIAMRRAAGGLDEAAQTMIRDAVDPLLAPAELRLKKVKGWKAEAPDDLLEMVSSLERVGSGRRSELGGWLLERTWTSRDPRLWSSIGRIGARVPAYASAHHVVGPRTAERWIDHLLREKWDALPTAARAAVELSRVTGDRARDVSESVRREVERRLLAVGAQEAWVRAVREIVAVEEADRAAFFGEDLPVGLRLLD